MKIQSSFSKYGLIVVAGLIIILLFLPMTLEIRLASSRIGHFWWFTYVRMTAGTPEIYRLFELYSFNTYPTVYLTLYIMLGTTFGGAGLLITSSLTRSRPKMAKNLVFFGLLFSIFAFISIVFMAGFPADSYMPISFYPFDLTAQMLLPHVGYVIGVVALFFGGIVIKMTDWEE